MLQQLPLPVCRERGKGAGHCERLSRRTKGSLATVTSSATMARRMDAMHAGTGSDNAPPPLEYGARPPLARRQSTYALLWVAAALVALLIGVFVARVAVRRWEVARVQARCMSHVPPPGATLTPATR